LRHCHCKLMVNSRYHRLLIASFFIVLSLLTGCMNADGEELGDWAVINHEGKIVHTMESVELVGPFSESILVVQGKESVRFLDKNFKTIFQSDLFSDPWSPWVSEGRILYEDKKTRKYGFLDSEGNIAIQAEYDDATDFSYRGYAIVAFLEGEEIPPEGSYAYGLIDLEGNRVLPMEYRYLSLAGISKGKVLARKDGKDHIIDISKQPHEIHQLDEGTTAVFSNINSSYGFVFYNNDGIGIMGWDGKEVIKPIFEAVWDRSPFGYVVNFEDEFFVIVDRNGNRIDVPEDIDIDINLIGDPYVTYHENDKFGVYDLSSLQVVIPARYESILSLSYNKEGEVFAVETESGCGYVDEHGNAITMMEYDVCGHFSEGYAAVKLKP